MNDLYSKQFRVSKHTLSLSVRKFRVAYVRTQSSALKFSDTILCLTTIFFYSITLLRIDTYKPLHMREIFYGGTVGNTEIQMIAHL